MAICCTNSSRRIANRRTDAYGGSLENRMRFPLEVFEAVRAAFPADKPVGIRVSATDWVEGGWDIEQTLVFAAALKERGVDWIDVILGRRVAAPEDRDAARLSGAIRRSASRRRPGVPTIAVGLITETEQAEQIMASGKADLDRAGPRHAVRSALALACSRRARRQRHGAPAILALAAAEPQRAVRRDGDRRPLRWRKRLRRRQSLQFLSGLKHLQTCRRGEAIKRGRSSRNIGW